MDLGGLDSLLGAAIAVAGEHWATAADVMSILVEKAEKGELGARSGQGFYSWTPESITAARDRIGQARLAISKLD